eukprot:TRINITY_DN13546_c0_g1_i1.p1 TRINITY_DN13546_c0_g1~~TRINITY_DN13546_c0_g1_i1.p1  ORF type:complete len:920 (+),score=206.66 TRINITY_DN13546_c0_g1_i1:52-2811(+)
MAASRCDGGSHSRWRRLFLQPFVLIVAAATAALLLEGCLNGQEVKVFQEYLKSLSEEPQDAVSENASRLGADGQGSLSDRRCLLFDLLDINQRGRVTKEDFLQAIGESGYDKPSEPEAAPRLVASKEAGVVTSSTSPLPAAGAHPEDDPSFVAAGLGGVAQGSGMSGSTGGNIGFAASGDPSALFPPTSASFTKVSDLPFASMTESSRPGALLRLREDGADTQEVTASSTTPPASVARASTAMVGSGGESSAAAFDFARAHSVAALAQESVHSRTTASANDSSVNGNAAETKTVTQGGLDPQLASKAAEPGIGAAPAASPQEVTAAHSDRQEVAGGGGFVHGVDAQQSTAPIQNGDNGAAAEKATLENASATAAAQAAAAKVGVADPVVAAYEAGYMAGVQEAVPVIPPPESDVTKPTAMGAPEVIEVAMVAAGPQDQPTRSPEAAASPVTLASNDSSSSDAPPQQPEPSPAAMDVKIAPIRVPESAAVTGISVVDKEKADAELRAVAAAKRAKGAESAKASRFQLMSGEDAFARIDLDGDGSFTTTELEQLRGGATELILRIQEAPADELSADSGSVGRVALKKAALLMDEEVAFAQLFQALAIHDHLKRATSHNRSETSPQRQAVASAEEAGGGKPASLEGGSEKLQESAEKEALRTELLEEARLYVKEHATGRLAEAGFALSLESPAHDHEGAPTDLGTVAGLKAYVARVIRARRDAYRSFLQKRGGLGGKHVKEVLACSDLALGEPAADEVLLGLGKFVVSEPYCKTFVQGYTVVRTRETLRAALDLKADTSIVLRLLDDFKRTWKERYPRRGFMANDRQLFRQAGDKSVDAEEPTDLPAGPAATELGAAKEEPTDLPTGPAATELGAAKAPTVAAGDSLAHPPAPRVDQATAAAATDPLAQAAAPHVDEAAPNP